MEINIVLVVNWEEFKTELDSLVGHGDELQKSVIGDEEELKAFVADYGLWKENCLVFLENSFKAGNQKYKIEFRNAGAGGYSFQSTPSISQQVTETKRRLKKQIFYLWGLGRQLEVCDAIVNPNQVNLGERAKYNVNQKLNFILEKLYDLHDDYSYPVKEIIEGNGITIKHSNEIRELVKVLVDNGLVESIGGLGQEVNARITTSGAMYVEENREVYKESYESVRYSNSDLESKIDEVIETLKKNDIGQEVIFNELQELKDLYHKMNKKNWGEVVKGKLVDLALAKLIDNDTLSYIYESLVNNQIRLPKL